MVAGGPSNPHGLERALLGIFVPAECYARDEDLRRARVLVLGATAGGTLAFFATAISFLVGNGVEGSFLPSLLAAAAMMAGPVLLRLTGQVTLSATYFCLALTVAMLGISVAEGLGPLASPLTVIPVVPLCAVLCIGPRAGWAFALLCSAGVLVLDAAAGAVAIEDATKYAGVQMRPIATVLASFAVAVLATASDSQRRRVEEALRGSEQRHRALVEAMPDLMVRVRRDGSKVDYHAGSKGSVWPVANDDDDTLSISQQLPIQQGNQVMHDIGEALETGKVKLGELAVPTEDGERVYETRQVPSGPDEVTVIMRDVTHRSLAEHELEKRANTDGLTTLMSRSAFTEALHRGVAESKAHGTLLGLLFVDLDGFKAINDTHGHEVGDAVLVEVGRRIRSTVRETDIAARYGGDEFVVLIRQAGNDGSPVELGRRLAETIRAPLFIHGLHLFVGASIGIALSPIDSVDPSALLRCADRAMYEAKRAGDGEPHRYTPRSDPTPDEAAAG